MRKTSQHLKDEPTQLNECGGAGAGPIGGIPARSKRTHPWHASYSVLALMTSLLILNGCNSRGPAEQASEQAVAEMKKKGPLYENAASNPMPAESPEAAGHTMGTAPGKQPAELPATGASGQ